jgi:uncharacterized membrane protein
MPEEKQQNNEDRELTPRSGIVRATSQQVFYSAPIPPASEFEKYESVLPGSADRILKMAEKQGSHRRSIETVVITFDSLKSLGGLIGALIIVVIAMFIGLYLIMHDKPIAGFAAMLTPLAVVAGAFIYQKHTEQYLDKK